MPSCVIHVIIFYADGPHERSYIMLEYFDRLLFNALVEYNAMINRCMDDPAFADTVYESGIGNAIEHYMMEIVSSAENAGAISLDDWRTIRHRIGLDRKSVV